MDDLITPEIFDHLVNLAELDLSPEQGEYLRGQLNNQLKAIEELQAIPLDESIPISLHGVPYEAAGEDTLRSDEWTAWQDPQAIIAQAPESAGGYVVVPDIPHTTLG